MDNYQVWYINDTEFSLRENDATPLWSKTTVKWPVVVGDLQQEVDGCEQ